MEVYYRTIGHQVDAAGFHGTGFVKNSVLIRVAIPEKTIRNTVFVASGIAYAIVIAIGADKVGGV